MKTTIYKVSATIKLSDNTELDFTFDARDSDHSIEITLLIKELQESLNPDAEALICRSTSWESLSLAGIA